jgi:hypothetical protein
MTFPTVEASARPNTECVDYFNFKFDQLDLHTCWRKATEEAKSKTWSQSLQAKRRENATWRRFFQNKWNLKKCNPHLLLWNREMDENRFFAPFYPNATAPIEEPPTPSIVPSPLLKPALKKTKPRHILPYIKTGNDLRKIASDTVLVEQRRSPGITSKSMDFHECKSPIDIVKRYFEDTTESCSSLSTSRRKIRFDFEIPQSRVSVDIGLDWLLDESEDESPSRPLSQPQGQSSNDRHMEVNLDQILDQVSESLFGSSSYAASSSDSDTLNTRDSPSSSPEPSPSEETEPIRKVPPIVYKQSYLLEKMEQDTVFQLAAHSIEESTAKVEEEHLIPYVIDSMFYETIPKEVEFDEMPDFSNSTGIVGVVSFGIHNTLNAASFIYKTAKTFTFW